MYMWVLLVLSLSSASAYQKELSLEWPERYSVRGTRISLTAGRVREFAYWRNDSISRLDYNKGTYKAFESDGSPGDPFYGRKYEIHWETTESGENEIVCSWTAGNKHEPISPTEVLPSSDEFKKVGMELIADKNTTKFYFSSESEGVLTRYTVWAQYDKKKSIWIPVRYREIAYIDWYSTLKVYDIWDYYNFKTNFSNNELEPLYFTDSCPKAESDEGRLKYELPGTKLNQYNQHFEQYKQQYNKKYKRHEAEHELRRNIYYKKLELVKRTNRQNLGYKLKINEFSDRTPSEMRRRMGLKRSTNRERGNIPFPYTQTLLESVELPKEYDLRILGLVAPVQDQGDCGCCWTMGTTAAVEGALARRNGGRLLRLSNQALIDCAWSFGNGGCDGGTDTGAYKWMIKYGLPTVEEYGPYVETDGVCSIANVTQKYPIQGFTDVTPYSEEALKIAIINHGPLSVSMDAGTDAFQSYAGGVFYDPACNATNLNHEVTLVGYGEQDGELFWIIKNSWGTKWGINGYMHISARDNNCGIAVEPTYAVL